MGSTTSCQVSSPGMARLSSIIAVLKPFSSRYAPSASRSASASLAKTVWGEVGQQLAALAFDVLGPCGADGRWGDYRLTSRSLTIAGGTTQINKNITAQRVLGLPRR